MLPLIGLIPLLPLMGFLVCGLLGRRLPKPAVTTVACGSVLLAFLVSTGAVLELRSLPPGERGPGSMAAASSPAPSSGAPSFVVSYWTWFPAMPLEARVQSGIGPL